MLVAGMRGTRKVERELRADLFDAADQAASEVAETKLVIGSNRPISDVGRGESFTGPSLE